MLPLAGIDFPTSVDALTGALLEGFGRLGIVVRDIRAQGTYPAIESLVVDLTGMQATREQRVPIASQTEAGELTVADVEIVSAPAYFEKAPVEFAIRAKNARFGYARDREQQPLLVLAGAASGNVLIQAQLKALEELLHGAAKEAAGQHGVDVKKTRLELTSRSPRMLSFRAEVTAKMFIASATIAVTGEIAVDEELNARISGLRFEGDGMIANIAAGYIRPMLARFEGRSFPLLAFSLGELRLRDLQINAGESLRISADFGIGATQVAAR